MSRKYGIPISLLGLREYVCVRGVGENRPTGEGEQERLANAKISSRQHYLYEGP